MRWLPLALAAACALAAGGCTRADPDAPPGAAVPAGNRWWHFYERGLAWADAGDDRRAEDAFRQCLRLRRTDARRARTWGLHFVQCFAHRELGAALLRQGRLAEAEAALRTSLADEPSAKAELLLQRVLGLRAGAPVAAEPPADWSAQDRRIELSAAEPGRTVTGRLIGDPGLRLWRLDPAGPAPVATTADGAFTADVPAGSVLALGDADGPLEGLGPPVAATAVQQAELAIDGPEDGAVLADGRAWYRWNAAAPAGLARLDIATAGGDALCALPLSGTRAAGTVALDLPSGPQRLIFTVTDAAGATASSGRAVEARPAPRQDRGLRAVALAIPAQAARPGAMRPGDDTRLLSALLADGRFRLVDQRADAVLARELLLVEAGHVDRLTAAEAGRRLAARYVIAGTIARGSRDVECFMRLIHCASGRVVATADAYAEVPGEAAGERLFAAAAGRLRQAFPIADGVVAEASATRARLVLAGGAALMRVHILAPSGAVVGAVDLDAVADGAAEAAVVSGSVRAGDRGVGE